MTAAYLKQPCSRAVAKPPNKIHVTDHALVRWLSRVGGVDMEFFREEIRKTCENAAVLGATRLRTAECDFVMLNGAVITVLTD